MKSQLSSLEINYIVKEFQILKDSRVDKIFQAGKQEFYLQFYVRSKGKKIIKITDKLMYFSEYKPNIEVPPEFCMYLRKQLNNAILREIKQLDSERIVEFTFEKKEGIKKLIIELFGGGNLLLLDEKGIILSGARYEKYKDRDILPKNQYKYPKKEYNYIKITKEELSKLFFNSKKEDIVKSLAVDLGLGGTYSEEICLISGIEKSKKPDSLTEEEILLISKSLKKIINKKEKSEIIYKGSNAKDFCPFSLLKYKGEEKKEFETFNEAINEYYLVEYKEEHIEKSKKEKKLEKAQRLIKNQEEMIKKLENSSKENLDKAESIYSNYQLIKEILQELKKAEKKMPWQEIRKKLKGHKIIKEVNEKEKTITIEI